MEIGSSLQPAMSGRPGVSRARTPGSRADGEAGGDADSLQSILRHRRAVHCARWRAAVRDKNLVQLAIEAAWVRLLDAEHDALLHPAVRAGSEKEE